MIVREKIGNLKELSDPPQIDWLPLEWYETQKRIQRKQTESGKEITLRFLKENPALTQGDILFSDPTEIIAVKILAAECLVIIPKDLQEMAAVCYEIGNRHLPLFFEKNILMTPFENPLHRWLQSHGYDVKRDTCVMNNPIKTTTIPHGNTNKGGLFDTIMQLTQPKQ